MSQKFVPLITCDITFDQNYTSAWNLLKTFIALPSTYIRKVNIRHAFLCLLSRSEAVRALSGILKSRSVESGILPGLFKPFFQILHGLRSWIFIDNFIHYAPKILHKVDIWGIRGQHVFSIKFDRFFCTMPEWPWLRVLAHRLGRTSCGDWKWLIFACLLLHSRFYGEGQASLLSLICCWCSNRQSKSVLGVENVSQWDRGLSFRPIWSILNFFLTWYAGGTWLSWEPQTT